MSKHLVGAIKRLPIHYSWPLALVVATAVGACGAGEPEPEAAPEAEIEVAPTPSAPTPSDMSVRIVQPTDGAALASPVRIVLEVEGLDIVPAGEDQPRSGHHHLLVNEPVPTDGAPIPTVRGFVHLGAAQTEYDLELPSGEYTIIAVIGDFAHRILSPSVEDTIQIVIH